MARTDCTERLVTADRIARTDRIACVDLPALPLQLLLRDHPAWRGLPAAVVAEDHPQALLLWVNEAARRLGVLPGQRYSAALSVCRDLQAAPVPTARIAAAVEALHRHLLRHSPRVEPARHEPGVFWLDAGGLERVSGTPTPVGRAPVDGPAPGGLRRRRGGGLVALRQLLPGPGAPAGGGGALARARDRRLPRRAPGPARTGSPPPRRPDPPGPGHRRRPDGPADGGPGRPLRPRDRAAGGAGPRPALRSAAAGAAARAGARRRGVRRSCRDRRLAPALRDQAPAASAAGAPGRPGPGRGPACTWTWCWTTAPTPAAARACARPPPPSTPCC